MHPKLLAYFFYKPTYFLSFYGSATQSYKMNAQRRTLFFLFKVFYIRSMFPEMTSRGTMVG
jgi:hypothetical protein